MAHLDETAAMRYAIALSALGLGSTSPNPPVGCVILDHDGQLAGTGYHQRKGEPHAEAYALAEAGDRARGGTAVVTLEPCNHQGLTPPCRRSLLDAGIARVVISLIDPTSRGNGGATELRAAGVAVKVGLLEQEARAVLGDWLTAQQRQRPIVTAAFGLHGETLIPYPHNGVSALRPQHDLIVFTEHHLEEGRAGAHGRARFSLPPEPLHPENAAADLNRMYDSGSRTVLIVEPGPWARALNVGKLIDQLMLDVPTVSMQPIARSRVVASFLSANPNGRIKITDCG